MLSPDRSRFNVTSPPATNAAPAEPQQAISAQHAIAVQRAVAVRKFVAQVGGLENARRALELLALLSKAA